MDSKERTEDDDDMEESVDTVSRERWIEMMNDADSLDRYLKEKRQSEDD